MEKTMNQTTRSEKRRILIVDDELAIVNAVRRELLLAPFGRHRYEIETFTNPLAALERAKTEEFEVVISDYRMPEMDGLSFLKALVPLQPDCARIVLSGQTDFEALIRMINETHIYRFIPKPWSSYFLKSSINQAIDFREASINNRVLADSLRQRGIDIPPHTLNPIDQILVVDPDIDAAQSIVRGLTQRSALDSMFRMVWEEGTQGHSADLDSSRISVQISISAQHASKMADTIDYSCVISEYSLPGLDGAQLLAQIVDKCPDCACILMSDDVDSEGLITALDLAQIQAFLTKPWVGFVLRAAVAQALARRRLLIENRVLAQMCRTADLAPAQVGAIG
jgi:DNA-binding NtrC family response regulator